MKELLDAVWSIARDKIKSAFDEGYKAGTLDSYPDKAYWSSLASSMSAAAKAASYAPGWGAVIGFSAGSLILGFSAGVVACAVLFVN